MPTVRDVEGHLAPISYWITARANKKRVTHLQASPSCPQSGVSGYSSASAAGSRSPFPVWLIAEPTAAAVHAFEPPLSCVATANGADRGDNPTRKPYDSRHVFSRERTTDGTGLETRRLVGISNVSQGKRSTRRRRRSDGLVRRLHRTKRRVTTTLFVVIMFSPFLSLSLSLGVFFRVTFFPFIYLFIFCSFFCLQEKTARTRPSAAGHGVQCALLYYALSSWYRTARAPPIDSTRRVRSDVRARLSSPL